MKAARQESHWLPRTIEVAHPFEALLERSEEDLEQHSTCKSPKFPLIFVVRVENAHPL